jgi:uncharacterized protein YciI
MTEMDSYTLVLHKRGPKAFDFSEEELDELQAQHVAHLTSLREQGLIRVGGPFSDQPDETLRGMSIYSVGPEKARRHAEADPSVQAGRLAVDVMTWWTPPGELKLGGQAPDERS